MLFNTMHLTSKQYGLTNKPRTNHLFLNHSNKTKTFKNKQKNSDDDDSRDFSKGLAQQYVDQATETFVEMDEALSVVHFFSLSL